MDLELSGKRVLVTGGTEGIGLAVAEGFRREGAEVAVASRSAGPSHPLASGSGLSMHQVDLGAPGADKRLVDAVGDVDILINNAGAVPLGSLVGVDEETWRRSWDLKVFGYINLSRAYYERMAARGGGVIILIAGVAGERPSPGYIAGSTGNAALMAFGTALGTRSLDDNIRVVTVNPGQTLTGRMEGHYRRRAQEELGSADEWRKLLDGVGFPGGRPIDPREIADVVLFLSSARARQITGTVVTVDGGMGAVELARGGRRS